MSMRSRLRDEVREMGYIGCATYALDRLLTRVSHGRARLWALAFYVQPVPNDPMLAPARNTKLSVGLLSADEFPARAFGRSRAAIESRFSGGSVCVAARSGEELAGYMWLHFGRLRERMFACDFEALPVGRACWDYDFEIMPRYRLGRTFARLWDEAFRILRQRGIANTVSWIHYANLTSRRAHERMGARQAGWLFLLDVAGFKIALQSNKPYVRLARPSRRLRVTVQAAAGESHAAGAGRVGYSDNESGEASAHL